MTSCTSLVKIIIVNSFIFSVSIYGRGTGAVEEAPAQATPIPWKTIARTVDSVLVRERAVIS